MTSLYRPPEPTSLQILASQGLTDRAHPARRRTRAMLYMTHKRLFDSRLRNTSICAPHISITLLFSTLLNSKHTIKIAKRTSHTGRTFAAIFTHPRTEFRELRTMTRTQCTSWRDTCEISSTNFSLFASICIGVLSSRCCRACR
jgi:hypothetical protein